VPNRTCLVSFTDLNRIRHTAEVSASTLYEAAVLALVEFRRSQFVPAPIPVGATLSVRVKEPEQIHEVKIEAVRDWLKGHGRTPKDLSERQKLREILEANGER
jgi:hypothetical protein